MLVKRSGAVEGTVPGSFHEYAVLRLDMREAWSTLSVQGKINRHSVMWIAFLDRLQHANYDTGPVMRCLDNLLRMTDALAAEVQAHRPRQAAIIRSLNERSRRLFAWMEENDSDRYTELFELGGGLFERLYLIRLALLEAGADIAGFMMRIGDLDIVSREMAARLEYLALRHFEAAFRNGQYAVLSALCVGADFVKHTSSCWACQLLCMDPEHDTHGEEHELKFLRHRYELRSLCAYDSGFDFDVFDDDTNMLPAEVVDLLF